MKTKKKPANHSSYRNKADEIFMSPWRGQPCEVYQSRYKTVFHHIVNKSRSKALRYDPRNGLILCPRHHTFGNELAAHSTSQLVVERFLQMVQGNAPGTV